MPKGKSCDYGYSTYKFKQNLSKNVRKRTEICIDSEHILTFNPGLFNTVFSWYLKIFQLLTFGVYIKKN